MTTVTLNKVTATMLREHIRLNADLGQITYIVGAPGSGKTEITYQAAKEMGYSVLCFAASEMLPEDLGGFIVPDNEAEIARRLMPDVIARIRSERDKHGKPVLAFFDELNNGAMSIMAACFKLLHEGVAGGFNVPEDTVFVAAGNPPESSSAAQELPAPLLNRMATVRYDGPQFDEWADYALSKKIHPTVYGFLKSQSQYLHSKADFDSGEPTPTPRSWVMVSNALRKLEEYAEGNGDFKPKKVLRQQAVAARVGSEAAQQFEAVLKWGDQLQPWSEILKDPHNTPVTEETIPGYMQAVDMVARIEDKEQLEPAIAYARRLPREVLSVFCVGVAARIREGSLERDCYDKFSRDDLKLFASRASIGR